MKRKMVLLVAAVAIAAVGATMVLLYVRSHTGTQVATSASTGTHQVRVLTATGLITTGETAQQAQSEGKLELSSLPAANVVPGAVTSIDSMTNMVALAPIYPGEQVLSAMFGSTAASEQALPVPSGKLAVSFQLDDPGRVAGFLTPGSHVAIIMSYKGTNASDGTDASLTRVIVQNAEVLAVGPTTLLSGSSSSGASISDVDNTIVTVALAEHDADTAVWGSVNGALAFALLGANTPHTHDLGVTLKDVS